MRRLMICCGLLASLSALTAGQAPAPGSGGIRTETTGARTPTGNADNGKKLFASVGCYECHGFVGQGGAAGARLAPRPIPYPAFSKYVRHPTDEMPPYTEKVVSERELADIYAFLQAIPEPPAAKAIPALNNP